MHELHDIHFHFKLQTLSIGKIEVLKQNNKKKTPESNITLNITHEHEVLVNFNDFKYIYL